MLEGYLIALSNLDEFIHIIREPQDREEARIKLLAFEWTQAQVEKWGILIRSEARLDSAAVMPSPSGRWTPSWNCASTS